MAIPRLSVVVPNFNHGSHLPACLDSLLRQSVAPIEIIVIDDGSNKPGDPSLEVMDRYARAHSLIKPHRNPKNLGVVATMNRGIELATGDYLFFMAADDEVSAGFFEKSLALLGQYPQAALSCTVSVWTYVENGLTWHMGAGMANRACFLSPQQLVEVGRRGKLLIPTCSTIMKRQPLIEAGRFIPDLKWHCDWFATLVPAFRHGMCYVPEPLSLFQISSGGYYNTGRKAAEHQAVLQRLVQLLSSSEYADIRDQVRESGALCMFGLPMLRILVSDTHYRFFINATLLSRTLRRTAELTGKRLLPKWLARRVLDLLYHQPQKA